MPFYLNRGTTAHITRFGLHAKSPCGNYNGFTYGHDLIPDPKDDLRLPEIGQRFFAIDRYRFTLNRKAGYIHAVLFEAIRKDIEKKHGLYGKDSKSRVFQYKINDRIYWLNESPNEWGVAQLEWMNVVGGMIVEEIT